MASDESTPICVEVIEAIAEAEGKAASELTFTLHDHIDTEALELLGQNRKGPWELTFQVLDHQITVKDDRTIVVDEALDSR